MSFRSDHAGEVGHVLARGDAAGMIGGIFLKTLNVFRGDIIMKTAKNAFHLLFGEITWISGICLILAATLYVTASVYYPLTKYFPAIVGLVSCAFVFINSYIIITGLAFRLFVRPLREGKYRVNSRRHMLWRLNWNFYSYVFLFFRQYLFYNKTVRYLFLRMLRVHIHYSTYFAETVDMQDANNLLYFGKNAAIGSEVLLSAHLALDAHIHILKKLIIGDDTQIQARSCIAPGCKIGDNVIIGFENLLSVDVEIGDNTRTGVNSVIHYGAKIGKNCRIGHGVIIDEYAVIPDNSMIEDFTHVTKDGNVSVRHRAASTEYQGIHVISRRRMGRGKNNGTVETLEQCA